MEENANHHGQVVHAQLAGDHVKVVHLEDFGGDQKHDSHGGEPRNHPDFYLALIIINNLLFQYRVKNKNNKIGFTVAELHEKILELSKAIGTEI